MLLRGGVDLVFSSEVLSYLENWKDLVGVLSKKAKYLMVSLYIPEDPIGYVKSREELHDAVSEVFDIIESVHLVKSRFTILFAKSNMYHEV